MAHETHESRTHSWLGEDDPSRADSATINLEPERLTAHGASRTSEYAASWSLTTTQNWFTESLMVTVHGHGWSRHLELLRATNGDWSAEARTWGTVDQPEPGLADPSILVGAVDCDLGLCPVTNTMPILRLGLVHDEQAQADLTIAYVRMPSLEVVPALQRYKGIKAYDDDSGTALIGFDTGNFSAEVSVDADGIVIDYPGLAQRRRS